MERKDYRDKVNACFLGKNIGGTLGAPLECKRGVWDLEFYTEKIDHVLPNDDLDLQLVWLNACEAHGRGVSAEILSDYWLAYIVGDWSEYGACKNNLRAGLQPPFSGSYRNHNRDSCGAFIRSELWACLMPGDPQSAVQYALEDALCDHGGEGVYAEIFCAAVESAAFCEGDTGALIEIGLSYIPPDCWVARAVKLIMDCFQKGRTWKEARTELLTRVPCSFGMYEGYGDRERENLPVGELGFDAPANIGILLIGWLWGQGDFGKSLCISAGCGEDADCTAATLGALLGIIGGTQAIDPKWKEPIGDEIATVSINLTNNVIRVPKTVTELADRICALAPEFGRRQDSAGNMKNQPKRRGIFLYEDFLSDMKARLSGIRKENAVLEAILCYDIPEAAAGQTIPVTLRLRNKLKMQQWLRIRFYTHDPVTLSPCQEYEFFLDQFHGGTSVSELKLGLAFEDHTGGRYEGVIELTSRGRAEALYFPVLFFNRGARQENN